MRLLSETGYEMKSTHNKPADNESGTRSVVFFQKELK